MKKFLLTLALVLLISPVFAVFAADSTTDSNQDMILVASWMWKTDEKIKKFRFKVNNDDPSYWDHVVNGDVTTHSIRGVKPGEVYTLYLQQSYDGENWSDTAISTLEVQ